MALPSNRKIPRNVSLIRETGIPGNQKIGNGYNKFLPPPDIHTIENPGSLIADSLMKPGHSNPHPVVIG